MSPDRWKMPALDRRGARVAPGWMENRRRTETAGDLSDQQPFAVQAQGHLTAVAAPAVGVRRRRGFPVRFTLTAGQKGDAPQAEVLLADLSADVVLADAAYDSDHLRETIAGKGATAVIPNNPSRARKHALDRDLYKERHLIECCFAKLKQFRRVATRYEKTARNYSAVVTLAAIVLWLR